MVCNSAQTPTVLDGNVMEPIGVNDEEVGMTHNRAFTKHAGVIELNFQAN